MLGRKEFRPEEIDRAVQVIDRQLSAYDALVSRTSDTKRREFEAAFFNNMVLVLDRFFVHRLRVVTGKDTNPLNEVELITASLLGSGGTFTLSNPIDYQPEKSVLQLRQGDSISLARDDFGNLYQAFISEIRAKFGNA